ncbi:MAG: penicillin-binding protein 2 [Candidatus Nanopelagicales bacterium]
MSDRSTLRLAVLGVLLASLLITLVSRLFFLQVVSADTYTAQSSNNRIREVVTPATRGLILDQLGRPLVANRTSLVVSVDRQEIADQEDGGTAVLTRLAKALGTTYTALSYKLELCGPDAHEKPPICWNGSPYQPIPVAEDISQELALTIMEKRSDYPGVSAGLEAVREYPSPYNANAAHILGYLGPVSDDELAAQKRKVQEAQEAGTPIADESLLRRTDLVGRSGLEAEYDEALRGTPGIKRLEVDQTAAVVGTAGETDSVPGQYLVTNIDAKLQSVVEKQLLEAVKRARATDSRTGPGKYKADSAAAVVMDVTNGHILAMASYPSYNPTVWVGGISSKEYKALTSTKSNFPLISRATQGQFVPASTFKIVTAAAALESGYSPYSQFDCPARYQVGNRYFNNFEGEFFGRLSMAKGLAVSCDTMWYEVAYRWWLQDGGLDPKAKPADPIEKMAKAFGLGRRTGIDLPSESRGRVGGREFKKLLYEQLADAWCKRAKTGYPEVATTDPSRAAFLKALAKENCADGDVFRAGDAVNLAIGQGDMVVTPLQMAQVYAAVANGGTIWQPQIAKGLVASDGTVVKQFPRKKMGTLPVSKSNLAFLRSAFTDVTTQPYGTGYNPFNGFPLDQIPVAAKTGTGQAAKAGDQSTSWFATFAPSNKPKYAVVMMVSQGGTGAGTSAPSVRKIYEAIYGIKGSTVDPSKSVLQGGAPARNLPTVKSDGTPVYPELAAEQAQKKAETASPSPSSTQVADDAAKPDQSGQAAGLVVVSPLLLLGARRAARRRRRQPPPTASPPGQWRTGGGP